MPYRGCAVGRVPGVAWRGAGLPPHARVIDQRPVGREVERAGGALERPAGRSQGLRERRGRRCRAGLDARIVPCVQLFGREDGHRDQDARQEAQQDAEESVGVFLRRGHCRPLPGLLPQ